jgi:hypothetical protein
MIAMWMACGLGNQMFQYALGRRLALERNTSLWLDLHWFDHVPPGDMPRAYQLNAFRVRARALPEWLRNLMLPPGGASWRFLRPRLARYVTENGLGFNAAVVELKRSAYLAGFWQTEKYFAPIAENIRAEFQLAAPMTASRQAIGARIGEDAVSIHVRRCEYACDRDDGGFFGTCSPEWYGAAIARLSARVSNPRFFVFSDDPAWARANLPVPPDTIFVDPQPDGRDFEDLHLMAKCRHNIIANSSFSWWAAWLNPSPAKIVIGPARWFLGEVDSSDRMPDSWIKL